MVRYAAFLRGINLGKRRVTGPQLCAPFETLGFSAVASFLASGNVVFTTDEDIDASTLEDRIAAQLESDLGYEVATFLRSADELAAIVAREPFAEADLARSTGKPQVMLLARRPTASEAELALEQGGQDDLLVVEGREVHWLPAGGISQSTLDLTAFGKAVGPVTVRTANTLQRMQAKFFVT